MKNTIPTLCSVSNCNKIQLCKSFCSKHYQRYHVYGNPDTVLTNYGKSNTERFDLYVLKDRSGCWLWQGTVLADGYGQLWDSVKKIKVKAHRYSYEQLNGSIPVGMTIDHECHNADKNCNRKEKCSHRRCVNPDHLRAVSIGENTNSSPNSWAKKLYYPNGHAYDDTNTYITKYGSRACRECRRVANKKWYWSKKETA